MEKSRGFAGAPECKGDNDSMKHLRKRAIFGESRLLAKSNGIGSEIGPNIKTYSHDLWNTYFVDPYHSGDTIEQISGPFVAAASVLLEGTDVLVAGVAGKHLVPPSGPMGRTVRDFKELGSDIIHVHPIHALTDVFRIATTDLLLDIPELATGHRQ